MKTIIAAVLVAGACLSGCRGASGHHPSDGTSGATTSTVMASPPSTEPSVPPSTEPSAAPPGTVPPDPCAGRAGVADEDALIDLTITQLDQVRADPRIPPGAKTILVARYQQMLDDARAIRARAC